MTMKRLNFFPSYAPYLRSGAKTTTLRLQNTEKFTTGETVMLTTGWDSAHAVELDRAVITAVRRKCAGELDAADLAGESPDCRTVEAARLVLSGIYRRELADRDCVFIIDFRRVS